MPTTNPIPPHPPTPQLINAAPGQTTTTPGTAPQGSGAPVTSYTPQQAQVTQAQAGTMEASPYAVADKATVAGQLKDLIAKGSPLMEEAARYAREQSNSKGLLNSSIAVESGQRAVLGAATPIAAADAATYATYGKATTDAVNRASEVNAGLKTQVDLANAASGTTRPLVGHIHSIDDDGLVYVTALGRYLG